MSAAVADTWAGSDSIDDSSATLLWSATLLVEAADSSQVV
jgi:hypothetical protein